ncbi:hypothetical protein BC829DRAFT_118729 [Chytridium lagenaria]|nr:hypothetical protein BC829DRAFT_118729 [Chytridium lagenaria]
MGGSGPVLEASAPPLHRPLHPPPHPSLHPSMRQIPMVILPSTYNLCSLTLHLATQSLPHHSHSDWNGHFTTSTLLHPTTRRQPLPRTHSKTFHYNLPTRPYKTRSPNLRHDHRLVCHLRLRRHTAPSHLHHRPSLPHLVSVERGWRDESMSCP